MIARLETLDSIRNQHICYGAVLSMAKGYQAEGPTIAGPGYGYIHSAI